MISHEFLLAFYSVYWKWKTLKCKLNYPLIFIMVTHPEFPMYEPDPSLPDRRSDKCSLLHLEFSHSIFANYTRQLISVVDLCWPSMWPQTKRMSLVATITHTILNSLIFNWYLMFNQNKIYFPKMMNIPSRKPSEIFS